MIVAVNGLRSSLIDLGETSAHRNSPIHRAEIVALAITDGHSRIVVVRVKVLEAQNGPEAHERASIGAQSPRN